MNGPSNVRDLITLHEGRVPYAYTDSLGYLTIGIGHLIDKRLGGRLPDHIIDALFDHDLASHRQELEKALPWLYTLDPVRQAVLLDMTFNLGPEPFDGDGFKDWPKFVQQVRQRRFDAAADNMLSTLWARQVKGRAVRLADMMRTGRWPGEVFVGPF